MSGEIKTRKQTIFADSFGKFWKFFLVRSLPPPTPPSVCFIVSILNIEIFMDILYWGIYLKHYGDCLKYYWAYSRQCKVYILKKNSKVYLKHCKICLKQCKRCGVLNHLNLGFCQIITHKIESIILKLLDPLIENCSNW